VVSGGLGSWEGRGVVRGSQYTERSFGFSPDGHPFCSSSVVGRSFVTASEP